MKSITMFELVNGKEFIAEVIDYTETEVRVKAPRTLVIIPQQSPDGSQNGQQAMLQSTFYLMDRTNKDQPITLKREHIVVQYSVDKELENAYIQEVSGITPANQMPDSPPSGDTNIISPFNS